MTAEDHSRYYSCQLRTGSWECNFHRFNRRLEKLCMVWGVCMGAEEVFVVSWYVFISLAHFGSLSTNWALFNRHNTACLNKGFPLNKSSLKFKLPHTLSKVKKKKKKKAHRRANAALPHINVETGPLFSSSSGEGSMRVHSSFVVKWQLNRLFTSSNCSIHKGVSCCCFSAASLSSSSELSTNSVERVPASPKQTTCKKQGSRLPLLLWIYWTPSSNSVL